MKFIELEELKILKLQHIIDDISSDDNNIISEIEDMSIAEVKAYLGNRYDVDYIFNQSGDKRHSLIKRITTDMIIYFLMERVSGDNIPLYILEKYNKNIEFLTKVAKGYVNIYDLPKLDSKYEERTTFLTGSEMKFIDSNKN